MPPSLQCLRLKSCKRLKIVSVVKKKNRMVETVSMMTGDLPGSHYDGWPTRMEDGVSFFWVTYPDGRWWKGSHFSGWPTRMEDGVSFFWVTYPASVVSFFWVTYPEDNEEGGSHYNGWPTRMEDGGSGSHYTGWPTRMTDGSEGLIITGDLPRWNWWCRWGCNAW